MRVLALDSAFGGLSVATAEGQRVVQARHGAPEAKAAESLPGLASEVLAASGWRASEVDRFAVTLGPGGFTSLRAGLAFAKGLALATGKPLLGFTTLEALAVSAPASDVPIAAIIDAKRDEVFLQVFGPDRSPLTPPQVVPLFDLASAFPWPDRFDACGSGSALLGTLPGSRARQINLSTPDVAALALHCSKFAPHQRPAEAVYLRPADARPMA